MTVLLPDLPENYLLLLPQINTEEVKILWHSAFYDGPRDGVISYHQQPYWFTIREDAEVFRMSVDNLDQRWNEWYQRFVVIELTITQFAELKARNELFREKVGVHWDYDALGKRVHAQVKSQETWHEYYDVAATWSPIDLSQNRAIGWFERLFKRVEVG